MKQRYKEYVAYVDDRRFEYHIEVGLEPATNKEWYDFINDNAINDEERMFLFNSEHIRVYAILPSIGDGLLITDFDTAEVFEERNKSIREAITLKLQDNKTNEVLEGDTEEHNEEGVKYDDGKPMPGAMVKIFPDALMEVGKCIEYGTHKYPETDNWKKVENAEQRYLDALMRHLLKHHRGEREDGESHLLHLSHVAWNALAILQLYLEGVLDED